MNNVVSLVLGGGRGTRLRPLTEYRSKPAVPLAAKYRLIDIPLSNCINSGLRQIYVLTQFMSVSLHRHIRQTYRFDHFGGGFVELLAAQQTMEGTDWYEGTADAVRKNLRYLQQPSVEYVLILSGDQLYRMDFRKMLANHKKNNAEVSIAALPVPREMASSLGVMRTDNDGRVSGFLEKPQTDAEVDMVRSDPAWIDAQGIDSKGRDCLASMGIYLFNRDTLVELLTKTNYQDFGKEVFPTAIRTRRVQTYLFDDYWEDIGTIRAFYEANLSLAKADPPFQLASSSAPVYSRARYLPPSLMEGATISGSLIADGCRIGRGAVIENSVIGLRCIIGENVTIRNSVVMGADDYKDSPDGATPLGIGANSTIEGAILDKNCRIGKDVRFASNSQVGEKDGGEAWAVREGIPMVLKDATLPDGFVLD